MSFKWHRDGTRDRWIYDETWAVEKHGGRWYVRRDGVALLRDYDGLQAAMEAAEKLRIQSNGK